MAELQTDDGRVFASRFEKRTSPELEQALKERDFAELEDREQYDDEVVASWTYLVRGDHEDIRKQVVATKNGRHYERDLLGGEDWFEVGPPVPRTEARRTYNGVRRAHGNVASTRAGLGFEP